MSNNSHDRNQPYNTPKPNNIIIKGNKQKTLKNPIFFQGIGLHTGQNAHVTLLPAKEDEGIVLQRTDIDNSPPFRLSPDKVIHTQLATSVAPENHLEHSIATIEHLMAALYAMEIDNIFIQISGSEIPIFEGSSDALCFLIRSAGIKKQTSLRQQIALSRVVEVHNSNGGFARFTPHKTHNLSLSLEIDFPAPLIGKQHYKANLTRPLFLKELAFCRTFVNYDDIKTLHKNGMGLGGTLHNTLVVHHDHVLNPEGLYNPDEFVRHKVLDSLGDLYCSGYRLCGHFESFKTGHKLNNSLLRKIFSSHKNWRFIPDDRRL